MTATNGKSFLQIITYIKMHYIINIVLCAYALYIHILLVIFSEITSLGGQNKPLKGQYWHMILYRALIAGNLIATLFKYYPVEFTGIFQCLIFYDRL